MLGRIAGVKNYLLGLVRRLLAGRKVDDFLQVGIVQPEKYLASFQSFNGTHRSSLQFL